MADGLVSRGDIAALLVKAVGKEEAERAVARACASVGFGDRGPLAKAQQVLEAIAGEPGLVGITARFAKARLALRAS